MTNQKLQNFAGFVWLAIGTLLAVRGGLTLLNAVQTRQASLGAVAVAAVIGAIIGIAKGRFVLSKTALKNKDRIAKLTQPTRPWQVFSLRFYPLIALMMGMGIAIRKFFVQGSDLWRQLAYGGLLCGIGGALFISAFAYWYEDVFRKATPESSKT